MVNSTSLAFSQMEDPKYEAIISYLSEDGGYWIANDVWNREDAGLADLVVVPEAGRCPKELDFRSFQQERIRNEAKYYILYSMKRKYLSGATVFKNSRKPLYWIGSYISGCYGGDSLEGLEIPEGKLRHYLERQSALSPKKADPMQFYRGLANGLTGFITAYYDGREETEKDVWNAVNIPGARLSAANKSCGYRTLSFAGIPAYYSPVAKRFMKWLVTKRSWSHCGEMLMYIKYFFCTYYGHGYGDGFLEGIARNDIENYITWVSNDYAGRNATYRSKAISFVRQFLSYIQLAEYPQAPKTETGRLIYDDDVPRRERAADTIEKVKYIPEPIREQLDAAISGMEAEDMVPVYVLLRESGWRGTDILNLRYDNCLDHLWNKKEQRYVPYLCSEITKTGIPQLKIPIRDDVAEMVKKLSEEAKGRSTEGNNPDRYLFNTYEGRTMGMPISKPAFVRAVQELIDERGICNPDGTPYHFKTHALRHTRASEYAEQGMPIGIIQQILGHCSLQMTLHYAKVSENAMYEKWKEMERIRLFQIERPGSEGDGAKDGGKEEEIRYEYIRSSLDAVRVPFGICFKPSKLACRHQMAKCLECAEFCSTTENIPEYEEEIKRVEALIEISRENGRQDWEEKNAEYLEILKKMLLRIEKEGSVHKHARLREGRQ